MDGSKSVHYYDAKMRNIKVSRNLTFNENEEPGELKEIAKIPSLRLRGRIQIRHPHKLKQKIHLGHLKMLKIF